MPATITMPQLSDTMVEGTVVKWHRKEGDPVKANEEIADIETDKATMPLEVFEAGVLAHIAAGEGQKVKVGEVIAVIATAGEDPAAVKQQAAEDKAAAEAPAAPKAKPPEPAGKPAPAPAAAAAPAAASVPAMSQRVRISPLARRMAAEKGIDPSQVKGSGPNGRIVERDIRAFTGRPGRLTAAAAAPLATPAVPPGQTQVVAMTKMRSAIAAALQRSKQQIPHFYETIDIEMDSVLRLRQKLNQRLEGQGVKLSIADFVNKAVSVALLEHPALNARFNAEAGQITRYGDVNLGIATAIPDGLIVPVLRGFNRLSLVEIRQRTADLVERARAQRLKREEQTEATFTVSTLGAAGVREFSAIINPPEVAILAVGTVEPRAVVRDGQLVARTMMTVTLSADHRAVDGAAAAGFLVTLKSLLEDPALMLM